ncbi:MAG: sulfite exporter TauE/SafE family protein [Candidatus Kerfeldbacteria bacterium]|nr:sulfite exporter TauE/SafE family protein [Candidatus Kerfeldbacteria bacterium]
MTPLTAFLTGLSTGGLTCLAVQGGLLLGLLARRREEPHLQRWQLLILPVTAFLVAKLIIHTVLGFGLGWLGDTIQLTTTVRIWLQTLAGLFMLVAGVRLIFPHWLPWLTIHPPASARRLIRRSAKSQLLIAPAILGLLTVLIPCGTTQAMEVAAIATASPWQGASVMLAFVLGTAPLFFTVGILAKGTALLQRRLAYAAAAVVVALGLYTLNGVLVMVDSPYSIQNEIAAFRALAYGTTQTSTAGETSLTINVLNNGYEPNIVTVPAGQPVELSLVTNNNAGCTQLFRIPKLQIERSLPRTGTTLVSAIFPAPGEYTFSCGMGMFRGTIQAV